MALVVSFILTVLSSVIAVAAVASNDRSVQLVQCFPRGYSFDKANAVITGELALRYSGRNKLYRAAGNLQVMLTSRSGESVYQGDMVVAGVYNAEDRGDVENALLSLNGKPGEIDMNLRFLGWYRESTVRVTKKDGSVLEFSTHCVN